MSPFGAQTTAEEVVSTWSDAIKGRTFVITGPSAKSIGASIAINVARASPAHIVLVARTKSKIDPVIAEIAEIDPGVKTTFIQCDLTDQDSVRRAAAEIISNPAIEKIDVVINCAGVMGIKEYTVDKHGIECQLSANHIGHFLLTNLIAPKILAAGRGSRIVNVSSNGYRIGPFRFDDPNFSGGKAYDPWSGYGQSKTANMLFTVELARRLADRGIYSLSVHPGGVYSTSLGTGLGMDDFNKIYDTAKKNTGVDFPKLDVSKSPKTPSQGAAAVLAAALDPAFESQSGIYTEDCQKVDAFEYALDPENAKKLWALSEKLVGQKFDL